MQSVRAKKHLGQHFLEDLSIAKRIADTIDEAKDIPIVEIGPGMGVMTQFLLEKDRDLKVVEIDSESVEYLKKHFKPLDIIEGDFLKMNLEDISPNREPFAVIGNYPYNISSQIFFKILEWKDFVPFSSGMLQKEVAERLASPPGNKDYGILSVLLQVWYDIEYLFTVPPSVFNPPPKVNSGVIVLRRNKRQKLEVDEAHFKRIVKTAFNQRRKTLRNSLRAIFGKDNDLYQKEIFSLRPEQLSVEDFIELTKMEESLLLNSKL